MTDGMTTLDDTDTNVSDASDEAGVSAESVAPVDSDPVAETLTETAAGHDGDGEQGAELEDVEFAGKQYRLPGELKAALMMHADYTRKTQEVVEGRRALQAERRTLQQHVETQQNHLQEVAYLTNLNQALAAYEQMDWQKLDAEEPARAQSELSKYLMLRDRREALSGRIQLNEQKRAIELAEAAARQRDQTSAKLAGDIKGWNEVAPKLAEFARANGVNEDEMAHLAVNAPLVKLLHKAWLGDQLLRRQSAAVRTQTATRAAPETPEQVTKRPGPAASGGLSDSLSVEEWVKRRSEQVRKRT